MLVNEYKIDATKTQYAAIDEAIRIVQFFRNKCLSKWMNGHNVNWTELQAYCTVLAVEFPFASKINSTARQTSADRAWSAIEKFYSNCKKNIRGKKGYPKFQKDNRSIEYKTSGWKLDTDGKHIIFKDKCGIGRVRLVGTRSIENFPLEQVRRVRIVRRADGYYCQFCVKSDRNIEHKSTGNQIGIDMGLNAFYTDSNGDVAQNPRHYRKAEKKLKTLQQRVSRKQKGTNNRKKARKSLAKQHLKIQRQREDRARKLACALVTSNDLIAFEDLQVRNMVKNHHLAKSISDAGWSKFLEWVRYYAALHGIECIAVPPAYTSQNCSGCQRIVKKSLSVRTHCCPHCGLIIDRDHNAALNILREALRILGHRKTAAS